MTFTIYSKLLQISLWNIGRGCPSHWLHLEIFLWKYNSLSSCVSLWARKGLTGDRLMIVGSCIKYTAAGGEKGRVHAVWVFGDGAGVGEPGWAWVESVRKAQTECLGDDGECETLMEAEKGSHSLNLKTSDFSVSKNKPHSAHLFNNPACSKHQWTSKKYLFVNAFKCHQI